MAYGLAGFMGIYLMFGAEAGFVCNLICFIYPAIASIYIVDRRTTENALKWVLYWLIFGTFSIFDRFADDINAFLPVYWLFKCLFCMYLYLPQTDGANRFRDKILAPIFKVCHRKHREEVSLFELQAPPVTSEAAQEVNKPATPPIQKKVAQNVGVVRKAHLPVFCVIGGPGAGKGTQCAKMVEKYGLTHLSTGDLLRSEAESNKASAAELRKTMQEGQLVETKVVVELLKEAMSRATINGSNGFLIDGYPREIVQADQFDRDIRSPDLVLYFEASGKTLFERCVNRAKIRSRIDDNIETIKKRLQTYEVVSTPVVDYYARKGNLVRIKSEGTPEAVFSEVEMHMDKILCKH